MRRTISVLALVLAGLMTLGGCRGGDPKPEPTKAEPTNTTAAPSSNVAPAPPWPTLTDAEKAAVKQAFKDRDAGDEVIEGLLANPKSALANDGAKMRELRKYQFSPQLNQQARIIRELAEKNGRMTGEEKTEWRVPVKVDLESSKRVVQYEECSTLGTFRVFNEGKEVAQEKKPLRFRVTMNPAFEGSKVSAWRVSKIEESGTCEK